MIRKNFSSLGFFILYSRNHIKKEGLIRYFTSLSKITSLVSIKLNLRNNSLDDEIFNVLKDFIYKSKAITSLTIDVAE